MLQSFAKLVMWIGGWKAAGVLPDERKAVFIAAPHTSNWDGFWALTYKVAVGLDVRFFAKHSLFWFPLGTLLRGLGGIPLDRTKATSAVAIAVEMFAAEEQFYFGLAPEGTRAYRDAWKTGFYRIAADAGVPVYLGYIDYGRKCVGIGARLDLTGDHDADLEKCVEFYADIKARHPENATPIRFAKDSITKD